jgi:hypothetical protein
MTKPTKKANRLLADAQLRSVRGGSVPQAASEQPNGVDPTHIDSITPTRSARDANLFS